MSLIFPIFALVVLFNQPLYYERVPYIEVNAEVSAYTLSPDETDSSPNITASGKLATLGMVACPEMLSFGTKVEIGGKEYICEDRMNIRYRNTWNFDILMETKEQALKFGRQKLVIKVYQSP